RRGDRLSAVQPPRRDADRRALMARRICRACCTATAAVAITAISLQSLGGQSPGTSFSRGQNVAPAFEGWSEKRDGTFKLTFGYLNRNWDEEIDVPIGPDNNIEPGGPDQGQPTHLLPRRNLFVFSVNVPKDFGNKDLVWTLTTHGKTERAYGSLRPAYFIDSNVITANNGAGGGAGTNIELHKLNKATMLKLETPETAHSTVG